ncbi:hypothetical protein DI53_2421 [Sphingobacterium deserti]|uniref:Uncharacterized protein n=1 Tax=Sphingobacterium deserti TaxID=1229276 RepID=A0A0B8T7Q6_9SPHI|nr:hypothetical protein DI53_2421 [Sphingobacterium deserti]
MHYKVYSELLLIIKKRAIFIMVNRYILAYNIGGVNLKILMKLSRNFLI